MHENFPCIRKFPELSSLYQLMLRLHNACTHAKYVVYMKLSSAMVHEYISKLHATREFHVNNIMLQFYILGQISGLSAVLTNCTHLLESASPGEVGRLPGAPETD